MAKIFESSGKRSSDTVSTGSHGPKPDTYSGPHQLSESELESLRRNRKRTFEIAHRMGTKKNKQPT